MKKTAAARPVTRTFVNTKAQPGKMTAGILSAYNPDDDYREKHTEAIVPRFFRALAGKGKPDLVHSANIIEVNRFGATRIRKVSGSEEMRLVMEKAKNGATVISKLIEAGIKLQPNTRFTNQQIVKLRKIGESKKFKEDFAVASNGAENPFDEYIPLMGGPFSHQLYLHDYLDMLAKSFEAWNHNPLAHQIVKITTHFVLGRGVTFKARDPLVHKRFADWWDKNDMGTRLEFWSDMLSRDGELMIRKFKNAAQKSIFVRWVDPSTIWEIVTDIEDIERVFYYHQQYPTAYQVLYGAGTDKRFDPSKFESSKYVINQIPAEEICHIKINCSPNEKRGRSDYFSILGWLKRYKDFQTSVVLRAIIQATFAWKNKLEGTNTDVQAFINAFGTDQPEFGSVWTENGASSLEPMTADLKSGVGLADCPGIVNAIAVGSGVPKEYLGLTEHGTRATAVVASEPGVKKFQARQLLIGRLLKDIAQAWAENELESGNIPRLTLNPDTGLKLPTDTTVEFQFPEIAVEDRTAKIGDIMTAQQADYISKRRAGTMVAKELGIEEYDPEMEQEDIADEKMSDMASLYPGMGGGQPLPGQPGAAIPPAPGSGAASDSPSGAAPGAAQKPGVGPKKAGGLSGSERRAIKRNDKR